MTGRIETDIEEEDDHLAAARWVSEIEVGMGPERAEAFHAWLAANADRAELIAQQGALQELAKRALADEAAHEARAKRQARERAQRSKRRFLFGGAIAAGAMAFAGAVLFVRAPWADVTATYETATGEVREVQLADGSRLWLDARTHVSTHLTRERRDVELSGGRVFVEVAHDADRPFFVHGATFDARAVGTAYEVTVFPDRSGVAVTQGVVRLSLPDAPPSDLRAGQGVWISPSGQVTQTTSAPPVIAAWRERRMILSDRPLDAALAELSRYFERPLTVADADLAARRITISFSFASIDERTAAETIARVVGADVTDNASAGILLSAAKKPDGGTSQAGVSPPH